MAAKEQIQEIAYLGKIVPGKVLLDPALVKTLPDGTNSLVCGIVGGMATGFIERSKEDDTKLQGFKGQFQAVPAINDKFPDHIKPVIRSGVVYFPEAFHEPLAKALRDLKAKDETGVLRIAFKIEAVKDKNPAGYTWRYTPLLKVEGIDPLGEIFDDMLEKLPAPERKQLSLPVPTK